MKTNTVKKQRGVSRALLGTSVILLSLFMSGCSAHAQHRDKRHHKPHVSVSFEYDYYPGQHVYYDRHNHLYHYNHSRQGWLTVRILPAYIRLDYGRHHRLAYHHNRPWREAHAYKRHYTHHERNSYRYKQHRSYDRYDHSRDSYNRHNDRHERRYDKKHERRDHRDNRQHQRTHSREDRRDNRKHHDQQKQRNRVHEKHDRRS